MDLPSGEWFFTFGDAIITTRQKFAGHKGSNDLYRDKPILFCEDSWIPNDIIKTISIYSDFLNQSLDRLSLFKNLTTILTCNSDEIPDEEKVCKWLNENPKVKLYAQNLSFFHPRAFVLPIGQANSMWWCGDKTPWNSLEFLKDIKILKTYYENTHKSRIDVNSLNHSEITLSPKLGYSEYVKILCRSQFVLCPPGNGPDTHRFWEALAARAIPIVLSSSFIEQVKRCFPKIPMIVVNDYLNIDYNILFYEFPDKLEYLNKFYWINILG